MTQAAVTLKVLLFIMSLEEGGVEIQTLMLLEVYQLQYREGVDETMMHLEHSFYIKRKIMCT